jgi:hypothetical protein
MWETILCNVCGRKSPTDDNYPLHKYWVQITVSDPMKRDIMMSKLLGHWSGKSSTVWVCRECVELITNGDDSNFTADLISLMKSKCNQKVTS